MESADNKVLQNDLEEIVESGVPFSLLDGKTVFVTGATGLIGSQFIKSVACCNRLKGTNNDVHDLASTNQLIEKIRELGRKGATIQRYKGLGEMNPEQLWETTMDPARRKMLQVKLEDAIETDRIFTTLMGDKVEARRAFIQAHSLDVTNLDI